MTSPLILASLLLWGGKPTVTLASSQAAVESPLRDEMKELAEASRAPGISISIDPYALTSDVEYEPPVVLPGILLPDDGGEESHHAGS